ncbi:BON domain-containing protein [Microcoleus sp. LEGE 07076]|uniref:BON domain-containing protein n=1 Tax=Microcoleus sp. LEGE 07076 TaxID=915322 RepID=UPI00187FDD42|nr:BON domain-containing protein [Microcoleus sp. LEGE 07076]MBE9187449.1 BON domain-containing protein [Microcoleus sp. LEGE 07076]
MGWFKRLFGLEKPAPQAEPMAQVVQQAAQSQSIAPAKVGPDGNFDESGLAKRVALAFDGDSEVADIETVYVAQLSSTVVLKGQVPSQAILDKLVAIASSEEGATNVQTDQVTIG